MMNNNTPAEQLFIAENPNTPAARLVELALSEDVKILKAIARNPNTPPSLLVKLSDEFLEEIGENPALSLILIENPNLVEDIYNKHFSHYYPEKNINPASNWFLKASAIHSNSKIREFVARSHRTSNLLLEQLATDSVAEVRIAVASNSNTPEPLLEKLSSDPDSDVRVAVAYAKQARLGLKLLEDYSNGIVENWIVEIEKELEQFPEITFQTTAIHVTSDSIDNLIFALKDRGYQVEDLTEPFGIKTFRISR